MPRYYFPILDNDRVIVDEEGVELADLHTAISEARRSTYDMLSDALATGDSIGHQVIQVTNDRGRILATVRMDEAIEDLGGSGDVEGR